MTNPFKRKLVLVVCTGNTCRSPMGAALLRKRLGFFGWLRYRVRSAGLSAQNGESAASNAVTVMAQRGINTERHKAANLTQEMVDEAYLILGMTFSHCLSIRNSFNCHSYTFGHSDIDDPYMGGMDVYQNTAEQLDRAAKFRAAYLLLIPSRHWLYSFEK